MFSYLSGQVMAVETEAVVLDVGGVGFEIVCDSFTRSALRAGEKGKVHVLLRISDDRMVLYGFHTQSQKEMFLKLVSVSGVGPKVALAILSGLQVPDIAAAVVTQDEKAFQGISGVGKKTAQRLLLELRGKVDVTDDQELGELVGALSEGPSDVVRDATEALEGLGFTRPEAVKAVAAVRNLGDTAEELVRFALKRFGGKNM